MNLLCIDYGTKNIGLAINNGTGVAIPFRVLGNSEKVLEEIKNLCDGEGVEKIILGKPTKMDRSAGALWQEIKEFAALLKKKTGLPFDFEDEIFSSEAVKKAMAGYKSKYEKDAVEAAIILQGYLDRQK